MKAPGSPRWRKEGRPAKAEKASPPPELAETPDSTLSPEQMVAAAAPAAIQAIIAIMQKPGRNAAAQLRAAETLMRYGVQEPAKATTVSAPGGGAIQSEHRIVFVAPPKKP